MKLATCLHTFFDNYLPHIKGVSPNTIKSYRDTFKIFLPFAAKYYGIKIRSLRLEQISSDLILAFLNDLERNRKNIAKTRNHRLAALKSFAKMISFTYPENRELANNIFNIPQKRTQKAIIGFLYQEEMLEVFKAVDLKKKNGYRDYTLLHLLYDSGARASEIATLNLDYFNPQQKTLAILGKGDAYRLISLENKTSQLIQLYISRYRIQPKPLYQHRLFINQREGELTRHGVYRICEKHLKKVLTPKRLKAINKVHSFRHSRAIDLLYRGRSIAEIKNHLGHENVQSTTGYLQLDLNRKKDIQKQFIRYMQSVLTADSKIDELLHWESQEDILDWLDNL